MASMLSVAASTETKIPFNSGEFDVQGEWNNSTNCFVPKATGKYLITINTEIYNNTTNQYFTVHANINGANDKSLATIMATVNGYQALSGSIVLPLNAGDQLSFYIYGNAASCSVNSDARYTHVEIVKVA